MTRFNDLDLLKLSLKRGLGMYFTYKVYENSLYLGIALIEYK